MRRHTIRSLLCLIAFGCLAMAQTQPAGVTSARAGVGSFSATASFNPMFDPPAVTGAPYSGEEVSESVQVLVDGTRITRKMPGRKLYRDFAGRTRTERHMFPAVSLSGMPNPAGDVVIAEIYDPILGYHYTLDAKSKVAHRTKTQAIALPRSATAVPAPPPVQVQAEAVATLAPPVVPNAAIPPRPKPTSESLGTQVINGVQAEGTRMTITLPIGAIGNDRPISTVTETWTSSELKMVVSTKRSDPRSGENTMEILNLSRAEPDPNLFTIPADYTIVDETGAFSIHYGN